MLKSALTKIRTHLVVTVAAAVCMVVAVVALGFTVYNALCLLVLPVAASALTALIFFVLAAVALLVLQFQPRRSEPEPTGAAAVLSSIDWARFGPLAGQLALAVATIVTEGAAARRRGKDKDRNRR